MKGCGGGGDGPCGCLSERGDETETREKPTGTPYTPKREISRSKFKRRQGEREREGAYKYSASRDDVSALGAGARDRGRTQEGPFFFSLLCCALLEIPRILQLGLYILNITTPQHFGVGISIISKEGFGLRSQDRSQQPHVTLDVEFTVVRIAHRTALSLSDVVPEGRRRFRRRRRR